MFTSRKHARAIETLWAQNAELKESIDNLISAGVAFGRHMAAANETLARLVENDSTIMDLVNQHAARLDEIQGKRTARLDVSPAGRTDA